MEALLNLTGKEFGDDKKEKYRYIEASKTKEFLDQLNYWET